MAVFVSCTIFADPYLLKEADHYFHRFILPVIFTVLTDGDICFLSNFHWAISAKKRFAITSTILLACSIQSFICWQYFCSFIVWYTSFSVLRSQKGVNSYNLAHGKCPYVSYQMSVLCSSCVCGLTTKCTHVFNSG